MDLEYLLQLADQQGIEIPPYLVGDEEVRQFLLPRLYPQFYIPEIFSQVQSYLPSHEALRSRLVSSLFQKDPERSYLVRSEMTQVPSWVKEIEAGHNIRSLNLENPGGIESFLARGSKLDDQALIGMTELEELAVSNRMTDDGLFQVNRNLRLLDLRGNSFITNSVLSNFPNLEVLYVNNNISDKGLLWVPNLVELGLTQDVGEFTRGNITPKGILSLPKLKTLDIGNGGVIHKRDLKSRPDLIVKRGNYIFKTKDLF